MCKECRTRVHEHTDEYGRHGKRQYVDAEHIVFYHQRHEDWKDGDHRIEHGYAARLAEIVAAEHAEIHGEEDYEERNEYHLSGNGRRHGGCAGATALGLLFK